jgi:hypothetical protein
MEEAELDPDEIYSVYAEFGLISVRKLDYELLGFRIA